MIYFSRVGDSPIPGSGAYADNTVGAAAATGDGDILMRFLPSLLAIEFLRENPNPTMAAQHALRRIIPYYPNFVGALVVARNDGIYGAACYGMQFFPFVVYSLSHGPTPQQVVCIRS